jgi:two-component system catabolic regulation response regulator CreB
VRARLRRAVAGAGDGDAGWRRAGEFALDPAGQRIRYRGESLPLTRYEFRLLAALLARPGAILSREQLMDDVWRDAPETVDRTVDTHVKTLRAKLRAVSDARDPIRTHRGLGYSVEVAAPT